MKRVITLPKKPAYEEAYLLSLRGLTHLNQKQESILAHLVRTYSNSGFYTHELRDIAASLDIKRTTFNDYLKALVRSGMVIKKGPVHTLHPLAVPPETQEVIFKFK